MGKKKKLIKVTDIVRIPGQPRFVVELEPKGEDSFELICTVRNNSKVNYRLPKPFTKLMGAKIDEIYFREFDPDNPNTNLYSDVRNGIIEELAAFLYKLQTKVLELDKQNFTSGYFYENGAMKYYMLSDKYDLSEKSKQFEFLPCDDDIRGDKYKLYLKECLNNIHEFLSQNPSCLPIFLYTIMALSESALNYSDTHAAMFSAWIHSSDYKSARNAANLFANMFVYRPQSIYNSHRFHLNTSSKKGYDLYAYADSLKDSPLLVFSSSASHKLSAKKVNPILDKTYSGSIKFYPVFISPASTHSYKVLPMKIEDIRLKRSDFESLKECINFVYREFIHTICKSNSLESVHILVNDSFCQSLREILQSPLAFPLINHHCIAFNCKEKHVPREYIDLNIELQNIRNDIMRYIPDALDMELNISSHFQELQYETKEKYGEKYVIYVPILSSDPKTLYDADKVYDIDDFRTNDFVARCKRVILALNKLRKALCYCAHIYKLRYALEYYGSFMSKIGFDYQYRKVFMTEGYKILDKLLHKQPLPNTVSKKEQTEMEKDISRFLKALTKIIYNQLDKSQSNIVRNPSFRISHNNKCAVYEIDSKLFRKVADAKVDTPFKKFLDELVSRDILMKNTKNPNQPRFVFQRTVNSRARNYYVVRTDAIQSSNNEVT